MSVNQPTTKEIEKMSKVAFTIKLDTVNPHDLVRHAWGFRPTSRVVQSKKVYNRSKAKAECRAIVRGE